MTKDYDKHSTRECQSVLSRVYERDESRGRRRSCSLYWMFASLYFSFPIMECYRNLRVRSSEVKLMVSFGVVLVKTRHRIRIYRVINLQNSFFYSEDLSRERFGLKLRFMSITVLSTSTDSSSIVMDRLHNLQKCNKLGVE